MSYLVLARKYRPQTFEDLVGQDHVARTLANAIDTGRVAHAFLFTGVRGVGKTTSARLLAKCLNCVGPPSALAGQAGTLKGPTPKPCNECSPCREITSGQDLDVQEIDGASYNGVDEVRKLQEGMGFRPARDRFKVYIVDEVHMLSSAAWNAFLKTLEEPPPHVKFIFATTEVHKVPVTILSRCQRYDFKLISTQTIARRLEQVLGLEHIEATGGAVQVLAREAAGSMRDAMSLLDQVIAFAGTKLAADDVARVLGVADRAILHELASALVGGDAAACLNVVQRLAEQGFDLAHVSRDVLRHLRNLVVAKVSATDSGTGRAGALRELLDLADEEVKEVVDLAASADAEDLNRLFQGFSRAFDDIVRSGQPRMALEMALVRLARRPALLPIDELLSRLGDLERRLGAAGSSGSQAPAPRGGGGGGGGARGFAVPSGSMATPSTAPVEPGVPRTRGSLALVDPVVAEPPAPRPQPQPQPQPPALAVQAPEVRPPPAVQAVPAEPSLSALAVPAGDPWRAILERVRAAKPGVASVLEHALPLEVTAERVVFSFGASDSFLAARAGEPESLDLLTQAVRAHFRATFPALAVQTQVEFRAAAAASAPGVRTVAAVDAEHREQGLAKARQAVEQHPLVQEAMRLFGAQLREVRLPGGEG